MKSQVSKVKSGKKPAFQRIQEALIEMIESGKMTAGSLLPSEADLCKQFNVSRMTARNAISKMVEKKLVYRVHGKGTYVSESFADKDKTSGLVGLIMPGIAPDVILDIVHSPTHFITASTIESALFQADCQYNTMICRRNSCGALLQLNPEGIIVLYPKQVDMPMLKELSLTGIPTIAVHCMFEVDNVCSVNIDIYKAGQLAVEYLLQKGKKNILFVCSDMFIQSENIHYDGYADTVKAAGLKPAKCVAQTRKNDVDLSNYLPLIEQFDGIVTSDVYKASAIHAFLTNNGYRIPEDIEIVSYSDIDIPERNGLKVATLFYSTRELCRAAVDTFLAYRQNPGEKPDYVNIAPKLIIK